MIPFIDLKAQFKDLEKEIRARIDVVLEHGKFILGPEVADLEKELADFAGVKHAVTCASGTDALLMPLMALGVGPGDAVFTTPFTFIATAEVIALLGATPVFVDIDPRTYNINTDHLELAIKAIKASDPTIYPIPGNSTLTPKGIIPVDLFGLPADYDEIMTIAAKHDLIVLEDAAQGLGGNYKGRRAGGLGHIGAVSFFPAKPLGCYGDGGAVLTDDEELAEKLFSIRVHGKGRDKYNNVRIGLNARLDTIQAAILLAKLGVFAEELQARQQVADKYTELLQPLSSFFIPPYIPEGLSSAWAQYSVLSEKREEARESLHQAGIPSAVYYEKPLHLQSAFSGLSYKEGDFPVTEQVSQRIFSLPMHPYLREAQIEEIVAVLENCVS